MFLYEGYLASRYCLMGKKGHKVHNLSHTYVAINLRPMLDPLYVSNMSLPDRMIHQMPKKLPI